MIAAEVVRMKRGLSFLLVLGLLLSVFAFAETDDPSVPAQPQPEGAEETGDSLPDGDEGDDTNPLPVDIMEDEDLDAGMQEIQEKVLHYGDEGDDVTALQTRLK